MKLTKKKEKSLHKILKGKIDKIFSKWVRLNDKYFCYTCGKYEYPGQAGHYIHNKLDFEPMNRKCQCVACNKWKSGNLGIYGEKLIKEYGIDAVDALRLKSNQIWKPSTQELEDLLHYWSVKLESLKDIK